MENITYENVLSLDGLVFIEQDGNRIYNLCPHDLTAGPHTIPSNQVPPARVVRNFTDAIHVCGIPTEFPSVHGITITGLPEEQEGVYLVVSSMLRETLPFRRDLLSPTSNESHIHRNERGFTISVDYLQRNP